MQKGYTCSICNREREELPLCYGAPAPWRQMGITEDEAESRVHANEDLCIVDGEHFFIRGHLYLPIHESDQVFAWSVWCSLSAESFQHVESRWEEPSRTGDGYFGWLCTSLPCYEAPTLHLATDVMMQEVGVVPTVTLHPCEHPIYEEQKHGISIRRIEAIACELLCR